MGTDAGSAAPKESAWRLLESADYVLRDEIILGQDRPRQPALDYAVAGKTLWTTTHARWCTSKDQRISNGNGWAE